MAEIYFHQLHMITLLTLFHGAQTDNISLLELLECLNYVIKLDGLIHSIKLKLEPLKSFLGQVTEHFVQHHAEAEMLYLAKSSIDNSIIITGKLT
jgi:hypothetical protein